jgi:hypothetical protein
LGRSQLNKKILIWIVKRYHDFTNQVKASKFTLDY